MFLGAYHFDGDPTDLLTSYRRVEPIGEVRSARLRSGFEA
ncbi:MAG: hypothetical protein QOJ66_2655 [Ilumatobacteraceae bacterium]|jgi:hypothetical protein